MKVAKKIKTVTVIGPVVWGGVWGHGPQLTGYLAGRLKVRYFDPVVPKGATAPSFRHGDSYPVPDRVEVIRRRSRLRVGVVYGIMMELRNLAAAVSSRADCLVTYYPLGSILALAWCRITGRKSLFVFADFPDILGHPLARLLARGIGLKATARLATAGSVATSGLLYEDLARITPRAHHVPNGVDLDALSALRGAKAYEKVEKPKPEQRTFTAGFVGFFGLWVDFELLFEAARLAEDVRFVLVGGGPGLEKMKDRPDIPDNIEFTGVLPHDEVFREIDRMDVCLVPFKVNRITDRVSPVKLFEYWARGKPVLATPFLEMRRMAGSWPQAVGLFTDARELCSGIERLRSGPEFAKKASAEALEAVKKFDWQMLGAKILSIMEGGKSRHKGTEG